MKTTKSEMAVAIVMVLSIVGFMVFNWYSFRQSEATVQGQNRDIRDKSFQIYQVEEKQRRLAEQTKLLETARKQGQILEAQFFDRLDMHRKIFAGMNDDIMVARMDELMRETKRRFDILAAPVGVERSKQP